MQNELTQKLQVMAETFPGKVGLYFHDLKSNHIITLNADDLFPMASTYKIPLLLQLYRDKDAGLLTLTEPIKISEEDFVPGFGLLRHFAPGTSLAIKDIALLMITISDNSATDIIIKKVTLKRVNDTLQALNIHPMEVKNTTRTIIAASEKNPDYDPLLLSETTTPRAMGTLIEKIVKCEATSQQSYQDIKFILSQQMLNTRQPRKLVHLKDIKFFHKTGTTKWATNDVGFIQFAPQPELILCIYTLKNDPTIPTYLAEELITNLTEQIVEKYSSDK